MLFLSTLGPSNFKVHDDSFLLSFSKPDIHSIHSLELASILFLFLLLFLFLFFLLPVPSPFFPLPTKRGYTGKISETMRDLE